MHGKGQEEEGRAEILLIVVSRKVRRQRLGKEHGKRGDFPAPQKVRPLGKTGKRTNSTGCRKSRQNHAASSRCGFALADPDSFRSPPATCRISDATLSPLREPVGYSCGVCGGPLPEKREK